MALQIQIRTIKYNRMIILKKLLEKKLEVVPVTIRQFHNNDNNCDEIESNGKEEAVSIQMDVMDDFTTQLMHKKSMKWGHCKLKSNLISKNIASVERKHSNNRLEMMSINEINTQFQKYIDVCNNKATLDLMRECIKYKRPPCPTALFYVLNLASIEGDKDMIANLQELYKSNKPLLEAHSNFDAFLAQAIWVRGNVSKALEMFREIYKNNVYIRRRIRLIYRFLVSDIIAQHSNAVVITIIKFSETMYQEARDVFFLMHIWQACFLSEWYSDQCLAVDLLEKYGILCNQVPIHIPFMVTTSLKNHQTDVIYRLLEVLLKYDMQNHIPAVIIPLFHYQVKKGDLRSCNEIIEWSLQNDIKIPSIAKPKSTATISTTPSPSTTKKGDDYILKF